MKQSGAKLPERDGERRMQLGRLGDYVGFRMRRVQNQLSADFSAATSHFGIRSGLSSSLALIDANPGLSQQELSSAVGLDKSITVQIVDELERRGWARRERSTIDRRRHALVVLPEGKAFLDQLFQIMEVVEAEVLAQLSPEDRPIFDASLDRMYDVFHR
ncbi:MarR family winged helix-turn-helix transcriptional regulator [Sphingomonas sp. M1-B02]|uniref:MarR family winged helix-turn-helix transcriptional regulator n=1 Tax=Sphingomonas sp. M1-B02 TaxID=3114300 RepID=UPI00223F777E|nr:MarR family transcriptional regulator [Sphingomonas sp. S6-11]UZK67006.1 MarR family transcriptional regulator [Sphingomonas sp. S6-11]